MNDLLKKIIQATNLLIEASTTEPGIVYTPDGRRLRIDEIINYIKSKKC
jgi:hypothetical protein